MKLCSYFSASYNTTPTVILYGVCRALCIGVCRAGVDELANHTLPAIFNADDAEADLKLPDSEQACIQMISFLFICIVPKMNGLCRYLWEVLEFGLQSFWKDYKA